MADIKAQRDWLVREITKLADDAPDSIKDKITIIVQRVKQLNPAGIDDFANWLEIIFDSQDRIRDLGEKVEELTRKLNNAENALVNVTARYEKYESSAVLRQVAINVEYELKLSMLGKMVRLSNTTLDGVVQGILKFQFLALAQKTDPLSVSDYVYNWGALKGEWRVREVLNMKLSKAEKIATQYGNPEKVRDLLVKWFGDDIEVGRQKFSEAMSGLKLFSEDGAHPTNYHDEPLTLDTARQLVVAKAQFPKEIATEMREVAIRYVDMLGQIRAENHQISFLYNETM